MSKLTIISARDVEACDAEEASRRMVGRAAVTTFALEGYSLWMSDAELADTTSIEWDAAHGDDAVYVFSGEMKIDGRRCPAGGAFVVESGVVASATAVGATRIVHFGSVDAGMVDGGPLGAPRAEGHGVHVVGPAGAFESGQLEGVRATWFADGTCEACRCQLFEVTAPATSDREGKAHSHSEDEIIYLLEGSISMGAHTLEPFTALFVPADVRYALGGSGGHRFLNFRRNVSEQVYTRGSAPQLETATARGGRRTNDIC